MDTSCTWLLETVRVPCATVAGAVVPPVVAGAEDEDDEDDEDDAGDVAEPELEPVVVDVPGAPGAVPPADADPLAPAGAVRAAGTRPPPILGVGPPCRADAALLADEPRVVLPPGPAADDGP